MKQNRFTAFADEDHAGQEVQQKVQQVKKAEPQKKVVVKVQKADMNHEDAAEFEKVENRGQQSARGGDRRGGRGGNRGGDRRGGRGGQDRPREPREPREPRAEGEENRGRRGGRGRGDRPKTAQPVSAAEGIEGAADKKDQNAPNRGGRGGRGPRHQGKPREGDHPFDRKDGTGQGHRGDRKGGHGKGNWGKDDDEKTAAQKEEEEKRREERRERRERQKAEEEKKEEPAEEEEEEGFTLDDYFAAKQAKSQGLLKKQEGRQHDKMEMKNLKDENYQHDEKYTTKIYKKSDTQATKPNAGNDLLGFQATVDQGDEFQAKGKRGGRGGRDNQRPERQEGGARRRRGGKIVVDDNEFPTL